MYEFSLQEGSSLRCVQFIKVPRNRLCHTATKYWYHNLTFKGAPIISVPPNSFEEASCTVNDPNSCSFFNKCPIQFSIQNHHWKAQNLSFVPTLLVVTLLVYPAPVLGKVRYNYRSKWMWSATASYKCQINCSKIWQWHVFVTNWTNAPLISQRTINQNWNLAARHDYLSTNTFPLRNIICHIHEHVFHDWTDLFPQKKY